MSRELCRRANLVPSAVRSFGDARGSSWRLRSRDRRLLACFLSRALRSPPLAPNVNDNQAQSARFLRTLSAQNRRWPRLHLRGRPVAPPAGGRALRGRGRGRKEGSDSRTVFITLHKVEGGVDPSIGFFFFLLHSNSANTRAELSSELSNVPRPPHSVY